MTIIGLLGTMAVVGLAGMFVMWMLAIFHALIINAVTTGIYNGFYYASIIGLIAVYIAYPMSEIGRVEISKADMYAILTILVLHLIGLEALDRISTFKLFKGFGEVAAMGYKFTKVLILFELVIWTSHFTNTIPAAS